MLKRDYFIEAIQNEASLERDWVISCFSVTQFPFIEDVSLADCYPYQLLATKKDPDKLVFVTKDKTSTEPIPEYIPNTALFRFSDNIELPVGTFINVDRDVNTTYGNVIANSILLMYPFGNKIPFIIGKFDGEKIVGIVTKNLKDTPDDDVERDVNAFYVDELEKCANACTYMEAFSLLCVPTTSESTMLPNPAVMKLRDELVKKHAHELDNPVVLANIQEQMVKLDKETFKTDKASGFYLSGKAFNVVRMKKFGMMGVIGGIGDATPSIVTTSLSEGWDKNNLNAYIDDIRAGSYARGKSTAISGYGVKLVYSAFQSVTITGDDCGVKQGNRMTVTDSNYGSFIGRYQIGRDGEPIPITEEHARSLIGHTIVVRTPMLCKTKPPAYCAKCAGDSISMLPKSVHITASDVNSIYMNITMKSMHGKSLATAKYPLLAEFQ